MKLIKLLGVAGSRLRASTCIFAANGYAREDTSNLLLSLVSRVPICQTAYRLLRMQLSKLQGPVNHLWYPDVRFCRYGEDVFEFYIGAVLLACNDTSERFLLKTSQMTLQKTARFY